MEKKTTTTLNTVGDYECSMVEGFDVGGSAKSVDYRIDQDNFFKDVVAYSRSKQLLNEEQTVITTLIYLTGLLADDSDYTGAMIKGSSASGKCHMKQEVIDDMFVYADDKHNWLYSMTAGSEKSMFDDDEWNKTRIGALNEMNKIPDEMMEFFKSSAGDDGGFTYKRNVADPESESGRKTVTLEQDPKSIVFMLADENDMEVEAELETRLMPIKVDENREKNRGVHNVNWGHENLQIGDTEHDYIEEREDLWHAVRSHIRDIPIDTPVLIPTADSNYRGDTWDAANVVEPMLDFGQSRSTRASDTLASLVKASALANYHTRPSVGIEVDGEMVEHIVAQPSDVGNLLACRGTLLALTHGLSEKKFAIIDAIKDRGTPTDATGKTYGAELSTILDYVEEADTIASMKKREVKNLLDEMNEQYLIDKVDHPEDGRKNYYKYSPRDKLSPPNIGDDYDKFSDVVDPIRDQPIEQTIDEQQEQFGAESEPIANAANFMGDGEVYDGDESSSDDDSGSLSDFADGESSTTDEYTKIEQRVAQRLQKTVDGCIVDDDNSIQTSHMVGCSPLNREQIDGETHISAERPPSTEDKTDSLYQGFDSIDEAQEKIESAIGLLAQRGVFSKESVDDGDRLVVEEIS
jgi:DNA-binding MarR family transcriptional regulator